MAVEEAPEPPGSNRVPMAIVFGLALALRAAHWLEIRRNDPFFEIASVDGAIYDEMARTLLAGGGFGEGVLFLGPLYPVFMAAVYAIFGPSLPAVKAVQVGLGAVSCVLVYLITRRLFGRRAALVAGLASALYGQHIFYSGTIMIVNLQVPLVLGVVLLALRGLAKPRFGTWILCGSLLGLSALARQTTLLLAPALALFLLFGMPGTYSFRRRFAWGTAFGVAVCALVLPFSLRNFVVADDLVLLNSTGGYNFYMGNQRRADGTWQLPPLRWNRRVDNPLAMRDAFTTLAEGETGRAMRASEVSSFWLARGVDEIRADPMRWLRLEFRKTALLVNGAEIWNNRSKEVSRSFSRVLGLPLVEMALIAPLGLLGLGLTARRWRTLFPLHAALAAYLVAALLFFVLSRYRLPATVLLIPFAAHAAFVLVRAVQRRDGTRLAVLVATGVGLAVAVNWPLLPGNRLHMAWYNLGNKYRTLERFDEAIAAYQASLAENPGAISTHNNLALALESAGQTAQAIDRWKQVRAIGRRIGSARHVERADRHLRDLGTSPPAAAPSSE